MAALTSTHLQVIFINHPNSLLCTQVVSEIGGHILRCVVYGRKQGERISRKRPEALDVSIINTLDINTHKKNHISYTTNKNGPRIIRALG